jgi:ubiquinone biosynthesis protein
MLSGKDLPSPLVLPSERKSVTITPSTKPSALRAVRIILHFPRFIFLLLMLKLNKSPDKTIIVQRLSDSLALFGPLWVKTGQVLSTRADLLPRQLSDALATIKDTGSGVPFSDIRQIIEDEAGCQLEEIYEEFAEIPFAASSLAQLHRAYLLHEKRWVAVKINKPNVEQLVEQDLKIAHWVVGVLVLFSVYSRLAWSNLRDQGKEMILRELDLRYEEYSLRSLKKKLRRQKIYVPDTFRKYSSRRVLVMEFIHAALMSDYVDLEKSDPQRLQRWLTENNIKPKQVARKLLFSVYRQIFEDNLFHADMHPGNVVLLKNSQVAVLDCRSMASLETELLDKYRMCMQAIADQRYATAADIYLLLAMRMPKVDVSIVKADLIRVWRRWNTQAYIKEMGFNDKSISYMFEGLNKTVFEHDFEIQWPLSKMARALANLDASVSSLNPKLNSQRYLRRYFSKAGRRETKKNLLEIPSYIPRSIEAIKELPRKISEFTLFQQAILRHQAQSIQGSISSAGYIIGALFEVASFAILLIEGLAIVAFSHHCLAYPVEEIVGKQIATIVYSLPQLDVTLWSGVILFVAYLFVIARRLKRRVERVDTLVPAVHAAI